MSVVRSFNDAINARNITDLAELMTDNHRFIDSEGVTVEGKAAGLDAWRGFFESFPDYRNVFEKARDLGDGVVAVRGYSECSVAALDGPAEWRATVRDARVEVWQVFDVSRR